MRKSDMMLGGPGLSGYAFDADVYCVDCGRAIIDDLYEPDLDYADDACEDTECVPVPIFFGESDGPEHCADCGEYLYGGSNDEMGA